MSKDYIIVEMSLYDGDKSLEDAVNKKIAEGYTVLGAPMVVRRVSSQSLGAFKGLVEETTKYTYAQAMVKDGKSESAQAGGD